MKPFQIIFFSFLFCWNFSNPLFCQKGEFQFVYAKQYLLQPRYKLLQYQDIAWSTAKLQSENENGRIIIEVDLDENFKAKLPRLDLARYWLYDYNLEAITANVVGYRYLLDITLHYGFWETVDKADFDIEGFIKEYFNSGHLVCKLDADHFNGVLVSEQAHSIIKVEPKARNTFGNLLKDYMLKADWFGEEQADFKKEMEAYLAWKEKKEQTAYYGDFRFVNYKIQEQQDHNLYYLDVSYGNICGGEYYDRKYLLYRSDGAKIEVIDENLVEEQQLTKVFQIEGEQTIYLFFQSPTNNTLLKYSGERVEQVDVELIVNYNCGC